MLNYSVAELRIISTFANRDKKPWGLYNHGIGYNVGFILLKNNIKYFL